MDRLKAASTLVPALAMAALAGCSTTPKQRLQGKWVGERVENFAPEQAGRAAGWVTGTSFDFKGARVTVSIPAESPRQGTYQLAQVSEDQLVLSFLRPSGTADSASFQFVGDEHLRWQLGDGRAVLLRKVAD